jgi:hypothetical protein
MTLNGKRVFRTASLDEPPLPRLGSAEHKGSKLRHTNRRVRRPLLGRGDVRISIGDVGWTAEFCLGGDVGPHRFPGAVKGV